MRVIESESAKDWFGHLPDMMDWIKQAKTVFDAYYRSRIAWEANQALLMRHKGPADDGSSVRVGYDPQHDAPIFIVKSNKGRICIASEEPLSFSLD